jgi:hypothetical protein
MSAKGLSGLNIFYSVSIDLKKKMRNEKIIHALFLFIPNDGVCICGMIILLYFFALEKCSITS